MNFQDLEVFLSEEELYALIPTFAGFIEMGRMQYKADVTSDKLASDFVKWLLKKNKKENFKIINGGK